MKIRLTKSYGEYIEGTILIVPDYTETIVVDMQDDLIASECPANEFDMFDKEFMSRGFSRQRKYKTKISFEILEK